MQDNVSKLNQRARTLVVTVIMLIIAAIHIFRVGTYLPEDWYLMYYYYASDIMIPFGFYFLLCIVDKLRFLRAWYTKALIIFAGCTLTEIFQAFDLSLIGQTFDYYDILMFAIGVALAALVDKQLFDRVIPHWKPSRANA